MKVPDECCHWVCLEELHPVGGKNDNSDRSGGHVINVRYTPGNGADIGLRLVNIMQIYIEYQNDLLIKTLYFV